MSGSRRGSTARVARNTSDVATLRARLAEAEEALRAIRSGDVDTLVVPGAAGQQVFTLRGENHAYRVLIESMNEGALMVTPGNVILYANQCFARLVKRPLEQVIGGSLERFVSPEDCAALKPLLRQKAPSGSKLDVNLRMQDGSRVPARVSVQLPTAPRRGDRAIGIVVTDMTAAKRSEEMLRSLAQRVVQVQEAERNRVALDLHDNITQLLCATLFHSQALTEMLAKRGGREWQSAMSVRDTLAEAAAAVERISRNLRPGALETLGLAAVVRTTSQEFSVQTGVPVRLACTELGADVPADVELALYRVLQEALTNVLRHARAGNVTVTLTHAASFVQLSVRDDGRGFNAADRPPGTDGTLGLGLLGMRERAAHVGGTLNVRSAPGKGTTIRARVPLNAAAPGGVAA